MASTGPDDTVRLAAHGLSWRSAPEFAPTLPLLDVLRLRDPAAPGPFHIVKDNNVRTVAHAALPGAEGGPAFYVKRFKLPGLGRRLKHLVVPTQAAREWTVSRALRRLGIPSCRVLAVAERRTAGLPAEAFLVSEEIPGAQALGDWLGGRPWQGLDGARRRELADELAALVAGMIRAGVFHRDLHAGNVLIAPDAPAGSRLSVVDLHRMRIGACDEQAVAHMLCFLADSTTRHGVTAADRVRFLRGVLAAWKGAESVTEAALRAWAERVRAAWREHRRRRARSRTRRCLLDSSEFARGRAGGFRIFRRRTADPDALLALADAHRQAVGGAEGRCRVRKAGPRTEISLCEEFGGRAVFVKAYLRRGLVDRVKDLLRPHGRARDAWVAHRGFRVRGVPAPEGIALLEAVPTISGRPDYLVTEAMPVIGDLQQIAFGLTPDGSPRDTPALTPAERRRLAPAIAELFLLLAEREVRHPDMKPSNILVGRCEDGLRLWLVDLERARFEVGWRRSHWVHHLAQCDSGLPASVTLLERMRCLRRCGAGRWSAAERMAIARDVLAESLQRGAKWLA